MLATKAEKRCKGVFSQTIQTISVLAISQGLLFAAVHTILGIPTPFQWVCNQNKHPQEEKKCTWSK